MTECFVDVIAEKTDTQSAKIDTENLFEILPDVGTFTQKRHLLYFQKLLTGA